QLRRERASPFQAGDILDRLEKILIHAFADHTILAVLGMVADEMSDLLGACLKGALGPFSDEVEVRVDFDARFDAQQAVGVTLGEKALDERHQAWKAIVYGGGVAAVDDLIDGHAPVLICDRDRRRVRGGRGSRSRDGQRTAIFSRRSSSSGRENVLAEMKPFFQHCVASVRRIHVFRKLGDGNVEVQFVI
ncbi:hypothetical protein MMC07_009769, partial [Pseudocyphellaria aurata]|nr:hypothetical protein [Pseudocyphellaria aurata]